jgi:salicylate hydroxylase
VARVHAESRRNEGMLHLADGPDQRERDQILAGTADVTQSEWLYGYDADAAVTTPADHHEPEQEEV